MTAEEFTVQIMDMKKRSTTFHAAFSAARLTGRTRCRSAYARRGKKRDSLKSAGAFRAWVTRILINECYDICRRGSKIVLLDEMPEAVAPRAATANCATP